jgi:four helix bundle protein
MQSFADLKVWAKAHALALETYRTTQSFPADERFGLVSQMRRAAASVPANIAEGCARSTDPDFARFLSHAIGSASELEYFALLARDLAFLNEADYRGMTGRVEEVKRMLAALIGRPKADS